MEADVQYPEAEETQVAHSSLVWSRTWASTRFFRTEGKLLEGKMCRQDKLPECLSSRPADPLPV